MKATYDPEARALYLSLRERHGLIKTNQRDNDGLLYDFDDDGLVGIEVLLPEPLEIMTNEATVNIGPPAIEVTHRV